MIFPCPSRARTHGPPLGRRLAGPASSGQQRQRNHPGGPLASALRRLGAWAAALALTAGLLVGAARAQAPLPPISPGNPFADVPADHWSLDALRRLKAGGLLDQIAPAGQPFQGRRAMTRYELAVLLAKLLDKVEAAKKAGEDISEEEKIVRELTREFQAELAILGVRVDAFDQRVQIQEKRLENLAKRRSNITIDGFYRATQRYVDQPTPTENYRFTFEERPFADLTQRGLTPLEQDIFLRLTGRASEGNALADGIEAFAEIRAQISGVREDSLIYGASNPNLPNAEPAPVVGDANADSFATELIDEKRVSLHRAHFIAQTPRLDLRIFSNEAATEPGDPSRLFSTDPGRSPGTPSRNRLPSIRNVDGAPLDDDALFIRDPFRSPGVGPYYLEPRPFAAFTGVEAGGEYRKFTYFGSALTDLEETFFDGEDRFSALNQFTPSRDTQVDSYNLRLTYEPWRFDEASGKTWLFGLTYNETAFSYDFEDDRNRVAAVDVQYSRRKNRYQLEATGQLLASAGRGAVEDLAYRLDARYRKGGFTGLMKGYYYGHEFRALTAQDPFLDTDIHFNFLRTRPFEPGPDTEGERLLRFQLRYEFLPEDLTTLDTLLLETVYQAKAFDRDPQDPRVNDHEPGSRFYVQAIADVDSRIHVEFKSEIQKDIPQPDDIGGLEDEEGTLLNDFRIDYRPVRKAGLTGELSFIDDFDARDADGAHFSSLRERIELQLQPSPAIFLKGGFETIENADITLLGLIREPVAGRNIHRFIGEAAFTVAPNFGLKALAVDQVITNAGQPGAPGEVNGGPAPGEAESNNSKIWVGEANWQLSRAFELRYVYAWQNTDLFLSDVDEDDPARPAVGDILTDFKNVNHFVQLKYVPSERTEVLFSYGDEYESPNDPLDNGPANFHRTPKIYQLQASTSF